MNPIEYQIDKISSLCLSENTKVVALGIGNIPYQEFTDKINKYTNFIGNFEVSNDLIKDYVEKSHAIENTILFLSRVLEHFYPWEYYENLFYMSKFKKCVVTVPDMAYTFEMLKGHLENSQEIIFSIQRAIYEIYSEGKERDLHYVYTDSRLTNSGNNLFKILFPGFKLESSREVIINGFRHVELVLVPENPEEILYFYKLSEELTFKQENEKINLFDPRNGDWSVLQLYNQDLPGSKTFIVGLDHFKILDALRDDFAIDLETYWTLTQLMFPGTHCSLDYYKILFTQENLFRIEKLEGMGRFSFILHLERI